CDEDHTSPLIKPATQLQRRVSEVAEHEGRLPAIPRAVRRAGCLGSDLPLLLLSSATRLHHNHEVAQPRQSGLESHRRAELQFRPWGGARDRARSAAWNNARPRSAADRISGLWQPGDFSRPARLPNGRLNVL